MIITIRNEDFPTPPNLTKHPKFKGSKLDKFNLNAIVNRTKIKITLFINASFVLLVYQKYYYFLYFAFYAKLLALYETRGTKVWLKIVFVHIYVYFFWHITYTWYKYNL